MKQTLPFICLCAALNKGTKTKQKDHHTPCPDTNSGCNEDGFDFCHYLVADAYFFLWHKITGILELLLLFSFPMQATGLVLCSPGIPRQGQALGAPAWLSPLTQMQDLQAVEGRDCLTYRDTFPGCGNVFFYPYVPNFHKCQRDLGSNVTKALKKILLGSLVSADTHFCKYDPMRVSLPYGWEIWDREQWLIHRTGQWQCWE